MLRALLKGSIKIVLAIYFRRIELSGELPDEKVGGRLFYGNHHNGLVDPGLVLAFAPLPMSPLAKSTLWDNPVIVPFLSATGAVPVHRRQDVGGDDVDNDAMFARVIDALDAGENILMFPEGISHNAPCIAPFKTGAARILLGTQPDRAISLQPIFIDFDHKTSFRSRVLIHFGPSAPFVRAPSDDLRSVTETLRALLEESSTLTGDEPSQRLLERVASLLLEAPPSADERRGARRLDSPDSGAGETPATKSDSPSPVSGERGPSCHWMQRRREALRRARCALQAVRAAGLDGPVERYFEKLEIHRIFDRDVAALQARSQRAGEWLWEAALLGLLAPLGLVGMLLFWPPYRIIGWAAGRLASEPDELSTAKILGSYVIFPIFLAVYGVVCFFLFDGGWALSGWVLVVASAFAALNVRDRLDRMRRVRQWLRSRALPESEMAALRAERSGLLDSLLGLECVNTAGPEGHEEANAS
ncbi:MAG: hypothetical protein CO108_30510 [Deltaproteobacteria bacterium CG_4_9_14_3_um_filter_63_12]|nr:MAG: hypothetical protein CO108_30510 [Deltaproteobacteria bacterium CG_4_9_14_3_um_filter_63_12]